MIKSKKLIFGSIIAIVFVVTISLITVFSFKSRFNAKKDESKLEQDIINNDIQQPIEDVQDIEEDIENNVVDNNQQLELDNDKKDDVEDSNQEINNVIEQPKPSVNQNSSNNIIQKPITQEQPKPSVPNNNVIKEENKQEVSNNTNSTVNNDSKNESNDNEQITINVVNENPIQNDNEENSSSDNNLNNDINTPINNTNNNVSPTNTSNKLPKTVEECNKKGIEIQLKYIKLDDITNTWCFSVSDDYGELIGYRVVIDCKSGNCDKYNDTEE